MYLKKCPIGCNASLEVSNLVSDYVLLRCPRCGQLIKQITEDYYNRSMEDFNIPNGTYPVGKDVKRSHMRYLKHLKKIKAVSRPNIGSALKLLDVGCSSGSFLHFAKKIGYEVTGIEPAPLATATARRKGLDVKQGFLENSIFSHNYFDVITLFEVIEHVKDPVNLLGECHRILKNSGILAIGTGNTDSWTVGFLKGEWDYFEGPGHISFFNPISMLTLASQTGFNLISLTTRRVSTCRKEKTSTMGYFFSKIMSEVLVIPAKFLNKGHDALFLLQKRRS